MRSLAPPKCILGRGVQFIKTKFDAKLKRILFLTNWGNVVPLMTGFIGAALRNKAHTILAQIAKLLSRGLRPIFGGGLRNNCHVVCTSNVLWMINMMTIVLARVCDLPKQGCVSMCINQWWHIHIAIHTHYDTSTTVIGIKGVSHVWTIHNVIQHDTMCVPLISNWHYF